MKKNILFFITLLLTLFITVSCNSSQIEKPIDTTGSTSTLTLTLSPSQTLTPTITPTATITPSPTPFGGSSTVIIDDRECNTNQDCIWSIYSLDLNTNQKKLIIKGYSLEGVSPDQTRLLVSNISNRTNFYGYGSLFLVNIDGSDLTLLSSNFRHSALGGSRSVYWSPVGNTIFFTEPTNLCSVQSDGTGYKQIIKSKIGINSFLPKTENNAIFWEEGDQYSAGWHDGLAFSKYGWTKSSIDGTSNLKLENVNLPEISFDGKKLAYLSNDGKQIYIMDLEDPSNNKPLVSLSDLTKLLLLPEESGEKLNSNFGFFKILWLPDNKNILTMISIYSTICDTSKRCVGISEFSQPYIVSVNGEVTAFKENNVELNEEMYLFDHSLFSPDGRLVAYLFSEINADKTYNRVLRVVDLKTMDIKTMKSDFGKNISPISMFWIP